MRIIVATGQHPNSDGLDLERLGIILIDKRLTTNPDDWVVGQNNYGRPVTLLASLPTPTSPTTRRESPPPTCSGDLPSEISEPCLGSCIPIPPSLRSV